MGSTLNAFSMYGFHRDHPHIHGEHPLRLFVIVSDWGSPPYTWGALGGALKMAWEAGITPIYMGSTVVPDEVGSEAEDHPHIHGEHKRLVKRQLWRLGSPPYTWGAQLIVFIAIFPPRITPIYMGSTKKRQTLKVRT